MPPTSPIRPVVPTEDGLKMFFEKKGFEVIDKRSNAGCLWVVGEKDKLAPYLKEAKELYGAFGNYEPNGGRATDRHGLQVVKNKDKRNAYNYGIH